MNKIELFNTVSQSKGAVSTQITQLGNRKLNAR